MNRRKIDRFIREIAKQDPGSLRLVITGGIAALLQGGRRPTQDIDFEIAFPTSNSRRKKEAKRIEAILQLASKRSGVTIQYSEDVGRWSSIAIPPRRPRGMKFQVIGKLKIEIMHPLPWSVGKMARALESDLSDIAVVFGNRKIRPGQAVGYWAKALLASPKSSAQHLFSRQVEDFLQTRGPVIKGWKGNAKMWIEKFNKGVG